jgi:DNA-binding LacI/PurR family transcriptional regulator
MRKPRGVPVRQLTSKKSTSLKELADHVGLAPTTVSLVMNGSLTSGIAPETRDVILAAARKLNYRPNFLARCLRTRRSFTIGVMMPEVSEGYNVEVLRGIEEYLLKQRYFYLVVSHHFRRDLIEEYIQVFQDRAVDGLIVLCAPWHISLPLPVATISSHHTVKGTTSVLLDHDRAIELALGHLVGLGHRKIAFIKGTANVGDTEVRWNAITRVAARMGLPINPKLVVQIKDPTPSSPRLGYGATKNLLASDESFTALFGFNDVSAIGAIHALNERGIRVPEDVSVMGFDDIQSAAYQARGLTTIRQPLNEMGRIAAETILRRISASKKEVGHPTERIIVAPELIVRKTTSGVSQQLRKGGALNRVRSRSSTLVS